MSLTASQYLRLYDEIDGDLTDQIKVEKDSYTDYCNEIGTYSITFSVSDASKNTATITIYVQVSDLDNPIINGDESINTYLSSPLSSDDILKLYTATDEYDGDITKNIYFKSCLKFLWL